MRRDAGTEINCQPSRTPTHTHILSSSDLQTVCLVFHCCPMAHLNETVMQLQKRALSSVVLYKWAEAQMKDRHIKVKTRPHRWKPQVAAENRSVVQTHQG